MQQHIRFCKAADGVRLAYATSGEGPPLVMAARGFRHLPVLEAGKVVGVISIGDVVKDIIRDLKLNVSDLMGYIMTDSRGG